MPILSKILYVNAYFSRAARALKAQTIKRTRAVPANRCPYLLTIM